MSTLHNNKQPQNLEVQLELLYQMHPLEMYLLPFRKKFAEMERLGIVQDKLHVEVGEELQDELQLSLEDTDNLHLH